MKQLFILTKRNVKLFFKDKGTFFTSLITPMILLVLYATFLGDIYRDSFLMTLPTGLSVSAEVTDGFVGAQLFSSLLAVSCVTVSFSANFLMVQDKVNGALTDFTTSPVKKSTLALAYYLASVFAALIVCYAATAICFIYLGVVGWFFNFADVLCIILDVFLLVTFGTALSSFINFFLSTQGQVSAVGAIVSSCYGFICGAYMPMSQFADGLQTVLTCLPGTYGTALIRNHCLRGVFEELSAQGIPAQAIDSVKKAVDCSIDFFGTEVSVGAMYLVIVATIFVLIGGYILLHYLKTKRKK